jgi:hypothetical protein
MGRGWHRLGLAAAVATLLTARSSVAVAQADPTAGSVRGTVTARGSGAPVSGVLLDVLGRRASAVTDSAGRFRLTGLPGGSHAVRLRRVGFASLEFEIDLAPGEHAEVPAGFLRLQPLAVTLDTVVVTADGNRIAPSLARQGFYERRRIAPGAFAERRELDRWQPPSVTEALRRLPGVTIVHNPNYHRRALRGGIDTRRSLVRLRNCTPVSVWLDGLHLGSTDDVDLDAVLSVHEIEAVEVYRGPSETPVRFTALSSQCGAVVLWSREPGGG